MKFLVYIDDETGIPTRYDLPGEDSRLLGPVGDYVLASIKSRIHHLQEEVLKQQEKRAARGRQITSAQKQAIFQADADRTAAMLQSDPAMEATMTLFPKEVHG